MNNANLSKNNGTKKSFETYEILTHFNKNKINSLFRNLTALNIFQLIKLNNDYKTLGYSTAETRSHLSKLSAFPFYVTIVTLLSCTIMLNIKRNKSIIFHIILGIFLSTWLPLLMLIFLISIGLVRINEK